MKTFLPATTPARKVSFMARLASSFTAHRQRLFLTPAESSAAAEAQLDAVNQGLAAQRQALRESIAALVSERTKLRRNRFEVKLTIDRAAIESCVGEQAAVEIAIQLARRIVERHRQLVAATERRAYDTRNT